VNPSLPTRNEPAAPLVDPRWFGHGLAVIRIFFGLIIFANGLAKLDDRFVQIDLGPYHANLIDRAEARGILNFEVNQRQITKHAPKGTQVPGLKQVVNDLVLAHWNVVQWVVTGIEVGAGALLIVGLASRGAALVDLGEQLFLALVYLSSNRWLFEQPHEYLPLLVLALVPAGRVWGLDALIVRRWPALRRRPF
jgi:uncharacterized membrane protein YphA (DoxX/SURF4 family)